MKREPNWQPISNLPLISRIINRQLESAKEQYDNFLEARPTEHVLSMYT